MKEFAYIDAERMEEAFQRQMEIPRYEDTIEHESTFVPWKFPDREGKKVVRRRSREHIQRLIKISEY